MRWANRCDSGRHCLRVCDAEFAHAIQGSGLVLAEASVETGVGATAESAASAYAQAAWEAFQKRLIFVNGSKSADVP